MKSYSSLQLASGKSLALCNPLTADVFTLWGIILIRFTTEMTGQECLSLWKISLGGFITELTAQHDLCVSMQIQMPCFDTMDTFNYF